MAMRSGPASRSSLALAAAAVAGLGLQPVVGAAAPQPAGAERPGLVVLDATHLDTAGEPGADAERHAELLASLSEQLRTGLADQYAIAEPTEPPACALGDSDCLLAYARDAGADLILAGAIHKVSTLIQQYWVGMFDARTGARVFYREMTFRGDDATAWRAAGEFLLRDLHAERPMPAGD